MIWIQQHAELLFCLVGCMLVTVIPRVGPVMYLHAESLPDLLRVSIGNQQENHAFLSAMAEVLGAKHAQGGVKA